MRSVFVFGFILALAALLGTFPAGAAPDRPERPAGSPPEKKRPRPEAGSEEEKNSEALVGFVAMTPEYIARGDSQAGWVPWYSIALGPDGRGGIYSKKGTREKAFIDGLKRKAIEIVGRKTPDGKIELVAKLLSAQPSDPKNQQWVLEEKAFPGDIPVKFMVAGGKVIDTPPPAFIRKPEKTAEAILPGSKPLWMSAGAVIMNLGAAYIRKDSPAFVKPLSDGWGGGAKATFAKNGDLELDTTDVVFGYIDGPCLGFDRTQLIPIKSFVDHGKRTVSLPERLKRYHRDQIAVGEAAWLSQGFLFIQEVEGELKLQRLKCSVFAREPFVDQFGPAVGLIRSDKRITFDFEWQNPAQSQRALTWRWPLTREWPQE